MSEKKKVITKKAVKKVVKKKAAKKASPKKTKKQTYIALVIDRSGSMGGIRESAFKGINEQLASIRANAALGGETFVSYLQFDDVTEIVINGALAEDIQDITFDQYEPRGCTALRDAVYVAIQTLKAQCPKPNNDAGFLVVTVSDGDENSSKDISQADFVKEITALEKTGKWTFTYMLSNVDIMKVAQQFNINTNNVSPFVSSAAGTIEGMVSCSFSTSNYLSMRGAGLTSTIDFYDQGK